VLSVGTIAHRSIVSDTAQVAGGQLPKLSGSFASTLTLFGALRIYAQLDGKLDYYVYNLTRDLRDRTVVPPNSADVNLPADQGGYSAYERQRRLGPFYTSAGSPVGVALVRGPYIVPGDFVRFRELAVTWTVPAELSRRLHLASSAISVGGRNLALWTRYDGWDPEVIGVIDPQSPDHTASADDDRWRGAADVAIDFSLADAVAENVPALVRRGINIVLGTTGWQPHEQALRRAVAEAGTGIVAAPNFATGVVMFEAIVRYAAERFAGQPDFGAWLHEAHHATKKDAPSGTALSLKKAMEQAGFPRPIDVSSTRAGYIPGIHTIGFDGPAETITLTHAARDRTAFARGALVAATWVRGKRGWFTMHDVLGLTPDS